MSDTAVQGASLVATQRRAKRLGWFYIALAAFVTLVFGFTVTGDGDSSLGLVLARDRFADFEFGIGSIRILPSLVIPAATTNFLIAAIIAFFGGRLLTKKSTKASNSTLALVVALFLLAFLIWAAAGQSFNLASMLRQAVLRSAPLTFGAIAGVLSERVAVVNIAIEGMLLGGAFTGVIVGSLYGAWPGVLAATITGAMLAWVLAVLSIKYKVDQIISGVVINIFVLGLTSFLAVQILTQNPDLNNSPRIGRWSVPILSDIPFVGTVLFQQNMFVYIMFGLVAVTTYGLFHTRWGLRARAVGEHPRAADTLGLDVYRIRYIGVILGGVVAGFGGAFFTIGQVGRFDENMTAGRGFIALAAMIFGRWHPVGAMGAAMVFGFSDAIANKLGILNTPIPSEFLAMAPYIATLIVVAGVVGKSRPPAADGIPYDKQ
ncbi:MAG: ABC transporter permease [Acidobacteria bacterium]|nr:ABC transporter permease [Acidobacteriota bacterium]